MGRRRKGDEVGVVKSLRIQPKLFDKLIARYGSLIAALESLDTPELVYVQQFGRVMRPKKAPKSRVVIDMSGVDDMGTLPPEEEESVSLIEKATVWADKNPGGTITIPKFDIDDNDRMW